MAIKERKENKTIEKLKDFTYSKDKQPTKEQRQKAAMTRRANRRLEQDFMNEFFRENVPMKIDGKEVMVSGIFAAIQRLKDVILYSKNEKLAMNVLFKLLERIWGKPEVKIEANVSSETQFIDRAKILEMIFNAKKEKVITIKQNDEN